MNYAGAVAQLVKLIAKEGGLPGTRRPVAAAVSPSARRPSPTAGPGPYPNPLCRAEVSVSAVLLDFHRENFLIYLSVSRFGVHAELDF